MQEHTSYFHVRKSVLLIAAVSIAATICYGCYFDAGAFQDESGPRASAASPLDPARQDELRRAFITCADKLTDEEYVAAAIAWDQELQASCQKVWQPPVNNDHFVVYDAMVREIEFGLAAIGPNHLGMRRSMESQLREAAQDLPME